MSPAPCTRRTSSRMSVPTFSTVRITVQKETRVGEVRYLLNPRIPRSVFARCATLTLASSSCLPVLMPSMR